MSGEKIKPTMELVELLPGEVIPLSTEYHLGHLGSFPRIIFPVTLVSLTILIAIMPILYISVSVKSPGSLRASAPMTPLKAPSDGIVKRILIRENAEVNRGQLLVEVISPSLREKEHFLNAEITRVQVFIRDLRMLTAGRKIDPGVSASLLSPLYRQALADYLERSAVQQPRFLKAQQEYDRNKKLYEGRVIAAAEFENYTFELRKASGDMDLLAQEQLTAWLGKLNDLEKEVAHDKSELLQACLGSNNLHIRAPVTGTIQNLAGINAGSPIFAGDDLAQISPDTMLTAAVNVSPADIGLLHEGMRVNIEINTFNYHEWGMLNGRIQQISADIRSVNGIPVFEILCSLDSNHLRLKNGYCGKLRKGMTLQARFVIAQRSLWQLLYDKVDDWTEPYSQS